MWSAKQATTSNSQRKIDLNPSKSDWQMLKVRDKLNYIWWFWKNLETLMQSKMFYTNTRHFSLKPYLATSIGWTYYNFISGEIIENYQKEKWLIFLKPAGQNLYHQSLVTKPLKSFYTGINNIVQIHLFPSLIFPFW